VLLLFSGSGITTATGCSKNELAAGNCDFGGNKANGKSLSPKIPGKTGK